MSHTACTQPGVTGIGPDGVVKGLGVLHGPEQDLGIEQRVRGLREAHTTRLGELRHFSELLTLEPCGERAQRVHMGLGQQPRAVLEHFHQTRLIERWVGIGWADQSGYTASDGCTHLGFQRGLVFETRLTQPRRQVDEAWQYPQALRFKCVHGLKARKASARSSHGPNAAACDVDVARFGALNKPATNQDVGKGLAHAWVRFRMLITAMRTAMPKVT